MNRFKPALTGSDDGVVEKIGSNGKMFVRFESIIANWPNMVERKDHAAPSRGLENPTGARQVDGLQPSVDQKALEGSPCGKFELIKHGVSLSRASSSTKSISSRYLSDAHFHPESDELQ